MDSAAPRCRDEFAIIAATVDQLSMLARVDGTTFAKYVSEVATAISGWLLRESRRCRRHG